ncbi:TPA: hypothetical protein DIS55_01250 [Candidatus Kaiserbacteria bacterium]|uniref:Uncharacterized protein n=1 Tax=Candidatus Kaiserbacteria bacterium RIFCSPLOWO2_12_FULL_50_28 TaxID=1798527 RepID=A0A1F6FRK4_9BACT|nr:MAG: hypothetical protein A3H15_02150 [Candidatus Kaiserbacteria bacterium RIFCSPLOWO2_12_FULL_50_28]HCM43563.1 hypothetical protein [Candidatus Kaiserbacteria bacterium]
MGIDKPKEKYNPIEIIPQALREKAIAEIAVGRKTEQFPDNTTPEMLLSVAIKAVLRRWESPRPLDKEKLDVIAQYFCVCGISKDTADKLAQILILDVHLNPPDKNPLKN